MKFRNLQKFVIRKKSINNRYAQKHELCINDKLIGLYKFIHSSYLELSYWTDKHMIYEINYMHEYKISIQLNGLKTFKLLYVHELHWEKGVLLIYADLRLYKQVNCSPNIFHSALMYCVNHIKKFNQN